MYYYIQSTYSIISSSISWSALGLLMKNEFFFLQKLARSDVEYTQSHHKEHNFYLSFKMYSISII